MTLADAKGQTMTRDYTTGRKFIDITGQKFGKWKVWVHVGTNKGHDAMFLCQCECGCIGVKRGSNLRRGESRQCLDCAKSQIGKANRKPHEDIDGIEHKHCSSCERLRPLAYFHKAKTWDGLNGKCTFCASYHDAMSRHGGDLTLEKYIAIRCQPCVVTGIVNPVTMSVDRIDSSLPYTLDNVQPMWSPLNKEKSNRDDDEFKAMAAPDVDQIRRSKPAYY